MRVPDDILKCTTFLCVDDGAGLKPGGTGFFVSVPAPSVPNGIYSYLVTAKHCLIEAQKYGDLFIRLNGRNGKLWTAKIEAPWIFPQDPSVDLAVLPIGLPFDTVDVRFIDHTVMITEDKLKEHSIGIGDDVLVAGLFTRRYGSTKNIPIIRVGNIAAMPDEPLPDSKTGLSYHAYLIEARSIGGLSGSPVFVHLPVTRPRKDGSLFFGATYIFLIGVIRGHWDHEEPKWKTTVDFTKELEQVNMGIAIATPMEELRKIIFGDELVNGRKENDAKRLKKNAPTDDSAFSKVQKTPQGLSIPIRTESEFIDDLKKASRKIEPHSGSKG